ncbi:hypothetical protein LPJ61_003851, partial [Coemansia biformis]
MEHDGSAVELRNLATRRAAPRRRIELPAIDTSVRLTNMGGSRSMPPSPTGGLDARHHAFGARPPSVPRASGDMTALREYIGAPTPRTGHAQSGRMTKVPHYGRLRSVTARVLRMADPRASARQQQSEDR